MSIYLWLFSSKNGRLFWVTSFTCFYDDYNFKSYSCQLASFFENICVHVQSFSIIFWINPRIKKWIIFFSSTVDLCELNLNVKKSFEQHNLRLSGDNLIDVGEIIKVLTTIFENIDTNRKNSINVAQCIDMTLNWLLNVFDRYIICFECFFGIWFWHLKLND